MKGAIGGQAMREMVGVDKNNHWFAVSARTNFSKPPVITGLSFELSALEYVMDEEPMSLQDSIFQQCSSVKETGREALCKHADFTGGPENYVGDPIYAYGAFSNASNVLVVSEYNASLASKLCRHKDFTGGPENYIGNPVYTYGVFSNSSKVLTLSEYKDSLATKFVKAVADFVNLRANTAWLLYNVHNEGPNNQCAEPAFSVLKKFSAALKGMQGPTFR
ncbi:hypothetical protein HPB51_000734 [Rhipicephalus microplus]|uniref:Uncharacterized protein n=1 Tax=Rhipicephalus microplus TaxID=6941 RepID=A0A9J6E605_RHIMP|nr:hypothetical protein HPB51_000734 [Rhipicephalus microplus]